MRKTVTKIKAMKNREKIVCLTCYGKTFSKYLDKYCDLLLVGDSMNMVFYGEEKTNSLSLETMIKHTKSVVKLTQNALIVADMPFGSFQLNKEQAFENCAKVIAETNCDAIKLEGGIEMVETVQFLVARGIPVLAHIGFMPQHVNVVGGFKFQGKNEKEYNYNLDSAKQLEEAGAFAIVLEAVDERLAADISALVEIPTIGIGASNVTDGQILVSEDMLGLFDEFTPKFVKKYAKLGEIIDNAVETYKNEVKQSIFPGKEHVYRADKL